MKKYLTLIAAAALALSLSACSAPSTAPDKPKAAVPVAEEIVTPAPEPEAEAGTRETPFAYGYTAEVFDGDESNVLWEITVGAPFATTTEIAATNEYNPAPAAGNEYIAIPVHIVWQGPDSVTPWSDWENGVDVAFVTEDGVTHETEFVVQPWPSLMDISDLYTGGAAEFTTVVQTPAGAAGTVRISVGSTLKAFWG